MSAHQHLCPTCCASRSCDGCLYSSWDEMRCDACVEKDRAASVFVKHDAGKPRMSLLPSEALVAIADVMTWAADTKARGDKAYPSHNWRSAPSMIRYFDALQRHLLAWNSGEETDTESGRHHLDHAGACIVILSALAKTRTESDDRWRK